MKYKLSDTILALKGEEALSEDEEIIEIMTPEEFKVLKENLPHHHLLVRYMENPIYCKAELYGSCALGTVAMPEQKALWGKRTVFGYYMARKRLIFVDEGRFVENQIGKMKEIRYGKEATIADFFHGFLDYLIQDDAIYLQQYERQLSDLEEQLLGGIPKNFYETVMKSRKGVMVLHAYYDQLTSLAETFQANTNQMLTTEQCQGFGNFVSRCSRLHDQTETLREYIMQIREMYQTQLDIAQNKTMSLLTIVTIIFLPLTLMVGWYGMNFFYMPELRWRYGYLAMIVLSLLIVAGELWFFKKKHLL